MSNEPQPVESGGSVSEEIPPEHVVSPALRKRLQQCFEHGRKLITQEKRDHDYANTMFAECVVKDPNNLVYVEAFLDNLQHKYQQNKRGARSLLGGSGGRGDFRKAVARKDWVDVLRRGPELLRTNPWDVSTLRAMAQACEAFRYNEVELRYLKNALDANPRDVDVNRHCARSLSRMGQFDQAIACWHRIEELKPNDPEPSKQIADLTIERTRARAGYGPPTSSRRGAAPSTKKTDDSEKTKTAASVPKSHGAPNEPAHHRTATSPRGAAPREITLTPIQRLEQAIAEDATIVENYLELIDVYAADRRLAEAERVLHRARSAAPGDLDVLRKGEELVLLRARHQLEVASQRAEREPTADSRELVDRFREQMARVELEVYDARSRRFPNEAEWKFRVGQSLKRLGNHREAAERFQQARSDGRYAAEATLELGACLQHLKQFVKALHCYQRSAEKAAQDASADGTALHKLALYRAGSLAAAMREWATAERVFKQLVAIDPAYKDAKTRLDKLASIDDKG
ncbi:MAG: tetratricopeptide repeat protein [Planctomycetes bacterium]|nr:tetratricopeptide repeat protein [Planctomycetota bacterium]